MTAQVATSVRPETWKEQLEYALKHHGEEAVKRRDGNETGLYLKGYAYRGTIDSERELEEVKSRLFSDGPTQCAIMTISMMPTTW